MKKVKKISEFGLMGGLGVAVILALNGCDNATQNAQSTKNAQNAVKNGAFVIIEEQEDGSYKILEEYPSDTTRVLLKAKDGTERMLSNDEIDGLLKAENSAIDAGTSELTNPSGTGLSLGGAILASAAGAIIGSWIGNKLFSNQNYQTQQRTSYKSPQAYERSQNSFNNARSGAGVKATNAGRSGFFGGGNSDRRNSAVGG